jgi:hypothetical protein
MELGDAGDALRAKSEQARRHAEDVRDGARGQHERAAEQREAEARAVEAARERDALPGPLVFCVRCNATWTAEAVREATRRRPSCLLCGGPVTAPPPE